MRLERHCTCGAVLNTNVPRAKRQQALIVWYDRHSGEGHADRADSRYKIADSEKQDTTEGCDPQG